MNNRINQLAMTPNIERQTPRNEFGNVLKSTLEKGASLVSGVLMNSVPGIASVSAAVSSVTAMAATGQTRAASTGIVNVGGSVTAAGSAGSDGSAVSATLADSGGVGMGDSIRQMRAEADRSLMVQISMQNESREYNALSNVIKVRHDSAKAAINNIR